MRKIILGLALALFALGAAPAGADQKDPRLDKLFAQLKAETSRASEESSTSLESGLFAVWARRHVVATTTQK